MKSAAKVRILYMPTKKSPKNILGTMSYVDWVLLLLLFLYGLNCCVTKTKNGNGCCHSRFRRFVYVLVRER